MLASELDEVTDEGSLLLKPIPAHLLNCRELIGWLQRAFVLSFYFLLRHKKYVQVGNTDIFYDSIRLTIQEGGDTDTNAAIVGGLLGALVGLKGIPAYMVQKVIGFDCNTVD
mgnify:CR=1 FL=1